MEEKHTQMKRYTTLTDCKNLKPCNSKMKFKLCLCKNFSVSSKEGLMTCDLAETL